MEDESQAGENEGKVRNSFGSTVEETSQKGVKAGNKDSECACIDESDSISDEKSEEGRRRWVQE